MKEKLQKVIEEVRSNTKCKNVVVMGSNKTILKKIDDMNLEDVNIFPVNSLTGKYRGILDNDRLYIFPNYQKEPSLYMNYEYEFSD